MILHIFAVRDNAVEAFMPPFFARARGEALRMFVNTAKDQNSQMAKSPMDYILYEIGSFDDVSGVLSPLEPVRLMSVAEIGESG